MAAVVTVVGLLCLFCPRGGLFPCFPVPSGGLDERLSTSVPYSSRLRSLLCKRSVRFGTVESDLDSFSVAISVGALPPLDISVLSSGVGSMTVDLVSGLSEGPSERSKRRTDSVFPRCMVCTSDGDPPTWRSWDPG